jgi:hypothetical protein
MVVVAINAGNVEGRHASLMTQMLMIGSAIAFVPCGFILLQFSIGYWVHASHRTNRYSLMYIFAVSLIKRSCPATIDHQKRVGRHIDTLEK